MNSLIFPLTYAHAMPAFLAFKTCLLGSLMLGVASHQGVCDSAMDCATAPARKTAEVLLQVQKSVQAHPYSMPAAIVPSDTAVVSNGRLEMPQMMDMAPDQPGGNQEKVQREKHDASLLQVQRDRAISFISIYDPFFETNMAASRLWKDREMNPHEWIILNSTEEGFSVSKTYAEGQARAKNDLLVFVHPDVLLPDDFYPNMMAKLADIERKDPNWGVLGTAGAAVEDGHLAGSVTDCMATQMHSIDDLEVQAVDESLIVLKKDRSPSFDPSMPGLDLVGHDIALAARKLGLKSWLLNVPMLHKTIDVDGTPYNAEKFLNKIDKSASYQSRLDITAKYFQSKWCNSGYLPNVGSTYNVTCTDIHIN